MPRDGSKHPLELRVESSAFVIGNADIRIVRLTPRELKSHTECLIQIPAKSIVERRIQRLLQTTRCRDHVAIDRIIDREFMSRKFLNPDVVI